MSNNVPQLNIDVKNVPNIRCPHCNNQVFQPLFIAKKISALQSPTGKESVAPMQIFACTSCGAVPIELGGTLLEPDSKSNSPEPQPEVEFPNLTFSTNADNTKDK